MNNLKALLVLGLIAVALSQTQNFTGVPVVTRSGNSYVHIGFNNKLYTFTLPGLNLFNTFNATNTSVTFFNPANVNGQNVTMSASQEGNGTYTVNYVTNSFVFDPIAPQPSAQFPFIVGSNLTVTDAQGNTYNYTLGTNGSFISKTSTNGSTVTNLNLTRNYNQAISFLLQNGTIYFTATVSQGRGSQDFDYYAISTTNFSIVDGPVTLPNTGFSGCPVPVRQCAVNVTVHFSVNNGTVVYVFTNGANSSLSVQVNTYQKGCNISTNSFSDTTDPSAIGTGLCSNNGTNGTNTVSSTASTSGTSGTVSGTATGGPNVTVIPPIPTGGNSSATTRSSGASSSATVASSSASRTTSGTNASGSSSSQSATSAAPTSASGTVSGSTGTATNTAVSSTNPSGTRTGTTATVVTSSGVTPTGDNSDPDSTCPPNGCNGNKCCNGQCYVTSSYSCLSTSSGGKQLCPVAQANLCGRACYSTSIYTCFTNSNGVQQLCPTGLSICGTACYSPTAFNCNNGQLGSR